MLGSDGYACSTLTIRQKNKPMYKCMYLLQKETCLCCNLLVRALAKIFYRAEPSYTLGYPVRTIKLAKVPGPGEHDPNYKYVKKTKPSYSFGAPFRNLKPMKSPPPNNYCEKKVQYTLQLFYIKK